MIDKNFETTAIIVAYHSDSVIERCLKNLPNVNKIIVDNSRDIKLKETLLNKYKNLKIIHPEKNLGFGAANNIGIFSATTEYVLCLNPDVIFEEKYIFNLKDIFFFYKNVGLVAPKVFDHNNNYLDNHCYSLLNFNNNNINKYIHNKIKKTESSGNLCSEFVTGAIFFSKKSTLNDVGLFDNKIFLYYEDRDLCKKIRDKNLQIIECASARAVHPNNDENRSIKLTFKLRFLQASHHKYSEYYFYSKYNSSDKLKLKAFFKLFEYQLRFIFYLIFFNKKKLIVNCGRFFGVLKFLFKT